MVGVNQRHTCRSQLPQVHFNQVQGGALREVLFGQPGLKTLQDIAANFITTTLDARADGRDQIHRIGMEAAV